MAVFPQLNAMMYFLAAAFYLTLIACLSPAWRARLVVLLDHARPPSSGSTVYSLDALRGIAILMVVLFHLFQWFNNGFARLGELPLVRNGWAGVELFVVLSGYLIYGVVRSSGLGQIALIKYGQRRFFRIYPVYFVTALVGIVFVCCINTPFEWHKERVIDITSRGGWLLTYEFLLLRAFYWPLVEVLNPSAWSLGAEVSFYLMVPLLVAITKKQPLWLNCLVFVFLFWMKSQGTREFGLFVFFGRASSFMSLKGRRSLSVSGKRCQATP